MTADEEFRKVAEDVRELARSLRSELYRAKWEAKAAARDARRDWREYRRTHPDYRERNCTQQRERDARRREPVLAKMDVSTRDSPVPSGTYRLSPVLADGLAKMDAWTVEIAVLSTP